MFMENITDGVHNNSDLTNDVKLTDQFLYKICDITRA